MNPVVSLISLHLVGKPAKTQAGGWQVEKLGFYFPGHVTIFSVSLCPSSGFSVHSFRVQDCNMYGIAQLGLIVSLVNTNYLVEFIAERKSPGFDDFHFCYNLILQSVHKCFTRVECYFDSLS